MVSRISTPFAVVPVAPTERSARLRDGESFEGRVTRHLGRSSVRISANGSHIDLTIDPLLPVGARVSLTVLRGPDGLHYRIDAAADEVPGSSSPAASTQAAVQSSSQATATTDTTIARLAAVQGGLAQLFASLSAVQAGGGAQLPQTVQAAIADLLGLRLAGDGQPGGEALRQAILGAGFLGDPATLQTLGAVSLRSALSSLRAALAEFSGASAPPEGEAPDLPSVSRHPRGQAPANLSHGVYQALAGGNAASLLSHLLGQTDGALARLALSALASSGRLGDGAEAARNGFDVTVEVPLALGPETAVIPLQIGRDETEGGGENGEHAAWRLRFALDFPETGAVEALVGLDVNRLFVTLWVERADTLADLRRDLDALTATLSDTGLLVEDVRIVQGRPSDPPVRSGLLVDTRS
ncbi:flagellar hook-length control protein FliK [Stappia sp. F7233]|uniref:Flagellar hook-length control protein FliK n=1 Tax=Stappia albiluteola TaxID=2758565 RepID=A0A839AGG4_9HYPH|nr:flagellar hook-length control protein FliK [Stappia albiluteola]MBA5778024.1 flagellar hook-length control protein FliK [Stappia albiluteola]